MTAVLLINGCSAALSAETTIGRIQQTPNPRSSQLNKPGSEFASIVLIDIRLGKRERIAQQFEARFRALRDDHLHDVEAKKDVRIVQKPQPGQTAAGDSLLLVAINCVEGPAEIFARPRFHFDENERIALAADDVDLAAAASTKITIEDLVTAPPQKPAGQFLPASPKPKMFGTGRRKSAAPPVRKIGDESDKARVHAI